MASLILLLVNAAMSYIVNIAVCHFSLEIDICRLSTEIYTIQCKFDSLPLEVSFSSAAKTDAPSIGTAIISWLDSSGTLTFT